MSNITSLKLWKDTGFTEGCLEVPKIGATLSNPAFTFDGPFNPSTSDMFSSLKVRVAYMDIIDCSYLSVTVFTNNGAGRVFYGWIDSIVMVSDTTDAPLTQINWHVDLWRTYISQASIGSGMVKRRPLLGGDSVPPQPYPFRYRTFSSSQSLISSTNWWIIFTCTVTNTTNIGTEEEPVYETTTTTRTSCFPVDVSSPGTRGSSGGIKFPCLNDVIAGNWDELLGLDPNTIYSAFASPIAPMNNMSGGWSLFNLGTKGYGAYNAAYLQNTSSYTGSISTFTATDTHTGYITGFDGEIIGSIPWGFSVTNYTYRLILDVSSAYIQIRFDNIHSHTEGLCFTIPLIPVSVTENSFSSYLYSGSRQADIMQSRAEADKARESTMAGTASSVTSSVASSAMLGSLGGPVGTLGGALIGGASSLISGTIGASTEYAITNKYSDVFQDITDYRMAHQSNGLIMAGSGFDCLRHGQKGITLMILATDAYSQTQRTNDISLYGVHVSEPMESCQQLVTAGGPLQITNATVKGSIPVEAKQYIRQRLAQGVRMV